MERFLWNNTDVPGVWPNAGIAVDSNGVIYANKYALNLDGSTKWIIGYTSHERIIGKNQYVYFLNRSTSPGVLAYKNWTLSASTNATYYKPGDTISITATSSMLQADPTDPGEDNQVQAVMSNNDKVTLFYASSNNSNTTWTGTYTILAGTTTGSQTATIQAAQYNVETDISTTFDSAPTGSNNTGISSTFSYTVDATAPTRAELISPTGISKDNNKPTLRFKKASDALSGLSSYSVFLDNGKNRNWSTTGIPIAGNGSASYVWKDDSEVKIEFVNEHDSESSNDEIRVYFKGLNNGELTEGKHSWKVTAYDTVGNSTDTSANFQLDHTSPSISELAIANVSMVAAGYEYVLDITNRTPSFSGKATDIYRGSERNNSDNTKDTFDKVSSEPSKIVLTIKKLKLGYTIKDENFKDHLSKEFSLLDIQDTQNQEKTTRFYTTTPYPLVDGYYQIALALKDSVENTYNYPTFYISLGLQQSISPQNTGGIIKNPLVQKPQVTKIVDEEKISAETEKEKQIVVEKGYKVVVKVIDENNTPVNNAKVELHSDPQTAFTNEKGEAIFENVKAGEHTIKITYTNFIGVQKISLTDEEIKEYRFTIQVKEISIWKNKTFWLIAGGLLLITLVLSAYMIRGKK